MATYLNVPVYQPRLAQDKSWIFLRKLFEAYLRNSVKYVGQDLRSGTFPYKPTRHQELRKRRAQLQRNRVCVMFKPPNESLDGKQSFRIQLLLDMLFSKEYMSLNKLTKKSLLAYLLGNRYIVSSFIYIQYVQPVFVACGSTIKHCSYTHIMCACFAWRSSACYIQSTVGYRPAVVSSVVVAS